MHDIWRRRLTRALAVAVLGAGLAGCSGSSSDPSPWSSTDTSGPDPADEESYLPAEPETSPDATLEEPVPAEPTPEDPPDEETEPEPDRPVLPDELVGEWDGDELDYTFGPDGQVSVPGLGEGTVEVDGDQIVFRLPGLTPWVSTWTVEPCADPAGFGYPYRTLWLDDVTYVEDC
ncbi:hypothetical protein [Kineosporia succinea]|uniref:Secreted protein n=1 Tax=Kineosporia succinea TaxID=84632 RepID=A0ABT9PA45_9ACTN|nr:hypothetical protein [Kineosporia succinea]MDP9829567.1 hypothetical protein [Kineosporia succinea]